MKITDMKLFVVDGQRANLIFVKLYTDEGITGVGEATLEWKTNAVLGAFEDLRPYIIGKDPRKRELMYAEMYRDSYWKNGVVLMTAISALEMALYDISGKWLNVPAYELLGGKVREGIRIYATNPWFGGAKTPEEYAQRAIAIRDKGVDAIKFDPWGMAYMTMTKMQIDKGLEIIDAVDKAVGKEVEILVEAHGKFNAQTAISIARELEPYRPKFFEEPVPPDNLDALVQVTEKSPVPIASGERVYTIYEYAQFLNRKAAHYIQPDICHAGGLMEMKKIAAMAQAHHITFAPHNPGGAVANAATMQLAACTENFHIMEISIADVPWRKDICVEDLVFENKQLLISDKPGLGVELVEEAFSAHPYYPKFMRMYGSDMQDQAPEGYSASMSEFYFKGF